MIGFLARAGGGHSFGGSSGGGGGGFGGGGGGGFFIFGGGGGGGGGIALFLITLVVVMLMFSLFRARGRSRLRRSMTGDVGAPPSPIDGQWSQSDQPAINSIRGDLFPGTSPDAHGTDTSEQGLAAIQAHDQAFSKEGFLQEVQRAFFIVEGAWSQRKPEMSRQVMADGLWQQHRMQIQGYVDAQKRNVLEDLAVGSLTIIAAHHDTNYDTITVRVMAACADYDVDENSGKIIRGDKQVDNWFEDWTFQRSATAKTPVGGGTLSERCPNCGAPLDLDLTGECKYCKAPISSGTYDWVLARIAQVPNPYV